jgi:hypothetical protein
MITEQFLLSLGFENKVIRQLPEWYNLFERDAVTNEAPSCEFRTNGDYFMTVLLFSKGNIRRDIDL